MLQFHSDQLKDLRLQKDVLEESYETMEALLEQGKITQEKADALLEKKRQRVTDLLFQKPIIEMLCYLLCTVAQQNEAYKSTYRSLFCTNTLSLSLLLPALEEALLRPTPSISIELKRELYSIVHLIHFGSTPHFHS